MPEANEFLAPVGVNIHEKAARERPAVDLPERDEFPAVMFTTTSGEGFALGASYAVQRVTTKGDPNYGNPKPNARPYVSGYVAPSEDGALTQSAANRFGIAGAVTLRAAVIEAIVEHADEATDLAVFLRDHGDDS